MGLILSLIAPVTQQFKERRQRKKEKKLVENHGPQGSGRPSQGATNRVEETGSQAQQQRQQSLHHSSALERGLEAESRSARPPPSQATAAAQAEALPAQERRELEGEQTTNTVGELDGAITGGEPALQREVGIAAPVPLAV
jgi:hypothetical protein